jgi:hypothetical protein
MGTSRTFTGTQWNPTPLTQLPKLIIQKALVEDRHPEMVTQGCRFPGVAATKSTGIQQVLPELAVIDGLRQ